MSNWMTGSTTIRALFVNQRLATSRVARKNIQVIETIMVFRGIE